MRLQALDLTVILGYLAAVTAVGWYFSGRQKDIRDYFLSDRNVPWWALAGSIVATETSTVTFISVPAFAFTNDLTFLQLATGYMIGRIAVVVVFIPQYFTGELLTVYQLLEQRFGGRTKRTAATLFLATRSVADGIRLFATALVLTAMTGWSDPAAILIVGVVTIAYTYLGGMAAVIWTDVAQLVIYLGGAVVAAVLLLELIPGGWDTVLDVGGSAGKFQLFDFSLEPARGYTLWAGLIGGAFLTTATHGTDQLMVQRYLCSRSPRQAAGALLASGAVIYAQFVLFLLIGVMLFVFYHTSGAPPVPAEITARADRIFPHFIVTQLPPGAVGLVVAAVLAAAMSTLSSSLNASAATSLADFYQPLVAPGRSARHYLNVSKILTVMWGIVQIGVALAAGQMIQRTVDSVLAIASFTSGPILGVFLMGRLRRTGQRDALVGMVAGIAFMTATWLWLDVSWQWYALMGSSVTLAAGALASLRRPSPL